MTEVATLNDVEEDLFFEGEPNEETPEEECPTPIIHDVAKADNHMARVKQLRAGLEEIEAHAAAYLAEAQAKFDEAKLKAEQYVEQAGKEIRGKLTWHQSGLEGFLRVQPDKVRSAKLIHGRVSRKAQQPKGEVLDKEKCVEFLKANGLTRFIRVKTTEEPAGGDIKKAVIAGEIDLPNFFRIIPGFDKFTIETK